MTNRKVINLLKAVAITFVLSCILFLLVYPSSSPLGSVFDALAMMMMMHYIAIVYGSAFILLRVFGVLKNNNSVMYILAGTINLCIAVTGIIFYTEDLASVTWVHKVIINLFIGFLVLADSALPPFDTKK